MSGQGDLDIGSWSQAHTINAAVLVALVEAVVLQDVQQARHLAEDEAAGVAFQELGQQAIQQHHLACPAQLLL